MNGQENVQLEQNCRRSNPINIFRIQINFLELRAGSRRGSRFEMIIKITLHVGVALHFVVLSKPPNLCDPS
jgi:hypothetical protein